MPFIPHTEDDIKKMLTAIGADDIKQLFDEIPASLSNANITKVPQGLNELSVSQLMQQRQPDVQQCCFIGAGAYAHHIPAAVWEIATRGEFYTAYTPYQAEASQGSLQLIYEYQTMMAELMDMDVSNASLYDGATSLAEAALMAVRIKRGKVKRILMPDNINPNYAKVIQTIVTQQGVTIDHIHCNDQQGIIDTKKLAKIDTDDMAALVIAQPNFFGCLEQVDALTDWAHQRQLLVIACVNPMAMALLKPPGLWGQKGADIVCGEGQPLGVPLASGGPYFGFMCCRQAHVRQLPGRVVGRTTDHQGREGFTLTLQAREQHIRRSKATSNICTNQGLVVVAATIYMSLLGVQGLHDVAVTSHNKADQLSRRLLRMKGVKPVFAQPFFHEFVIQLDKPIEKVLAGMADQGIQAGFDLSGMHDTLKNALLICVTETKTQQDLEQYEACLKQVLQSC